MGGEEDLKIAMTDEWTHSITLIVSQDRRQSIKKKKKKSDGEKMCECMCIHIYVCARKHYSANKIDKRSVR